MTELVRPCQGIFSCVLYCTPPSVTLAKTHCQLSHPVPHPFLCHASVMKRVCCPAGGTGTTVLPQHRTQDQMWQVLLGTLGHHTAEERWSVMSQVVQVAAPASEMPDNTCCHHSLDPPEQHYGDMLFKCTEQLAKGRAKHPLPLERNLCICYRCV